MAVVIGELLSGSRSFTQSKDGENDSATRRYEVSGTTSEIAAGALVASTCPSSITLPSGSTVYVNDVQIESGGLDDRWIGVVSYGKSGSDEEENNQNQPSLFSSSFDTSGGTFHVTTSLSTVPYGEADEVENWNNAINVGKDGTIAGIDAVVPQLKIDRTVAYPRAYVTDAFVNVIADLTGTVNGGVFFGRAVGEVLLLGATGENNGQPIININYSFLVSKNLVDIDVAGITGVNKLGHEHLWVHYIDEPGDNARVVKAAGVYVEQIYELADFGQLNIPGA